MSDFVGFASDLARRCVAIAMSGHSWSQELTLAHHNVSSFDAPLVLLRRHPRRHRCV